MRSVMTLIFSLLLGTILFAAACGDEVDGDGDGDGNSEQPYLQSDLTGSWRMHNLSCGSWDGWNYANVELDDQGNVVSIEAWDSDDGYFEASDPPGMELSITATGTVAATFDQNVEGFLASNRTLLVMTGDDEDGDDRMIDLVVKNDSATYSQSDLAASWVVHKISAGMDDLGGGWDGWAEGSAVIDDAGLVTAFDVMTSDDAALPAPPDDVPVTLASDGTLTFSESHSFHGVMSPDKNLMVVTSISETGDSAELWIFQRQDPETVCSQADLAGDWALFALSTGDWEGWTRGEVSLDATGAMVGLQGINSDDDPISEVPAGLEITVTPSCDVNNSMFTSWAGFLSADGRLLIAVLTDSDGDSFELNVLLKKP